MIELLKSEPLPSHATELVGLANESAENLLHLVDNVLDHSRIDADSVTVVKQPVDLAAFVIGLVALQRPAAAARGIEIGSSLTPDLPAAVITDPMRLRQILTNLVSNALKFTEQGRVDIDVTSAPTSPVDAHRRLFFHVRDTGCGFPPERLQYIFQPFAQADASISRRYGGSGLGLAISQRIAVLLDGVITVKSTPGRGSTFILAITVEVPAPPEGGRHRAQDRAGSCGGRPPAGL
jgi:two-component system sensor histidine kinase/response regulator